MPNFSLPETERGVGDIEEFVVLQNARSSGNAGAMQRVEDLRDTPFGKRLIFVGTEATPAATREKLYGKLRPGSGLIIVGGDGTVNNAVNDLVADYTIASWNIPILPAGAGNGDDTALNLNEAITSRSLYDILTRGHIRAFQPLQTTVVGPDGARTERHAVSYTGLGGTALGAMLFDAAAHRGHRLYGNKLGRSLLEGRLGIRTLLEMQTFTVEDRHGERVLSELTVANARREAKYGRWPADIFDRKAFVSQVSEKSLLKSVAWLGRLAAQSMPIVPSLVGPPRGHFLFDRPGSVNEGITFTIRHSPALIHWDAEWDVLPPDTQVDIRRGKQPVYAITTRDAAQ